jgi:hypothetical protein
MGGCYPGIATAIQREGRKGSSRPFGRKGRSCLKWRTAKTVACSIPQPRQGATPSSTAKTGIAIQRDKSPFASPFLLPAQARIFNIKDQVKIRMRKRGSREGEAVPAFFLFLFYRIKIRRQDPSALSLAQGEGQGTNGCLSLGASEPGGANQFLFMI